MAIRDHIRRVLPSSSSSSSSSTHSQADSATTTATAVTTVNTTSDTSSGPSSLKSTRFTLPWSRTSAEKEQRKEEKDARRRRKRAASGKPIHPRDKPLTETNLRHQEMLSTFDFSFGSSPSRLSQVVPVDYVGISPCCTRAPSLDGYPVTPTTHDDESLDPTTSSSDLQRI